MKKEEAAERTAKAMKRLMDADPTMGAAVAMVRIMAAGFRFIVHMCIGFGVASVAGLSGWWGIPFALVSSRTLGAVWYWSRRDQMVKALEEAADKAEREKA